MEFSDGQIFCYELCCCLFKKIRTFELKVHGGTPFESGVEVNPASNLRGTQCNVPRIHPFSSSRRFASIKSPPNFYQESMTKSYPKSAHAPSASGSFLPSLLRANRTPRLYVQLVNPTRTEKSAYSLIPSTIVTSSLYVKPIGCFRQLVGAAFLEGRLGLQLPSEWVKLKKTQENMCFGVELVMFCALATPH